MSYDKIDESESSLDDYTNYSENICFVISYFWNKREKYINTNYAMTGWILCAIPLIRENGFKIPNRNHMNKVNNVIKTFF